jgi:hypothetical protein
MNDTSGFYKMDGGELLYGPNFILNKDFELRRETHTTHEYPVDGWSWFDSEESAKAFFNIQE